MKAEDGTIYHPECYKDRAQALDTSADADTTLDNETTSDEPVQETTEEVVTKQEPTEEEEENKPSEADINPPSEASGVIEEGSIKKEEESEAKDDQCNNVEANEDSIMDPPKETSPEPMEESEVKTEELTDDGVKEEEVEESGNTSLVTDEHMQLAAPIMPQPKVVVTNWMGPSTAFILYSVQKYILGSFPLLLRGHCDYVGLNLS